MATTVNYAFDELLSGLQLTDYERSVAAGRVSHVQTFFAKTYYYDIAPWTIGSFGRETLIRSKRDIDMMVAMSVAQYWERYQYDSKAFLRWIRDALNNEYSDTQVSTREIAVRMLLGGGLQVDLVPGFNAQGGGFLIPNGSGGWQTSNPPYHDDLMTNSNVRLGYQLKPLVRAMKAWNHANGHHLQSFHLEMIVERMWRDHSSLPSMPTAVAETLTYAGGFVRATFADPWTGSGKYLNSYLTPAVRTAAATRLDGDAVRAKEALAFAAIGQTANAFAKWSTVFVGTFPPYG